MNKIIDIPRINRYALFSNVASVGGLLLLLASVVLPLFIVKLAYTFVCDYGNRFESLQW